MALLLVGGVVALVIWQPWQSWFPAAADEPVATPPPAATDAATPVPTPEPTPADTAPAETPAEPEPEESGAAPEPGDRAAPCTTADVTVTAVTDKESYGVGELPLLSITLTNDTALPCIMNVGTAAQMFEISSGSDVWWRSTDCQTESSDHVVQLEPGQTVASAVPLVWDRTRSSVDTCASARQKALPGYYNLRVSIGGVEPGTTRQFVLR